MQKFKFDTIQNWSEGLAEQVAMILASDVKKYGFATIAVSGGKSPLPFFEKLSDYRLPWDKITFSLVDERHVPATHPQSNAYFICHSLLVGQAGASNFIPLYCDPDIRKNINILNNDMILGDIIYSVLILGMGEDGHTASLFPLSPNLDEGLFDPVNNYSYQIAPDFPHQRISMNLSHIIKARHIFIAVTGEKKMNILKQATLELNKNLPISFILSSARDKISIFEVM